MSDPPATDASDASRGRRLARRFTPSWSLDPERLRELRRRWHRVLVLAGATGIAVGLATAGFEWITARVFLDHVLELPEAAQVVLPLGGLIAATLLVHRIGRTTPAISDDYLRAYHEQPRDTSWRSIATRIGGSIVALGSGVAMGFEGPAIYLGSTIGSWVQTRYRRAFSDQNRHVLLVAGAAAGVAAIFKAPATGAVFALEVPYQQDTASHAVVPALVASASSYLTYAAFYGTGRLFQVAGAPVFDARDLLGAVGLGLACGVGARLFSQALHAAKRWHRVHPILSTAIAGVVIAGLSVAAFTSFSTGLTLGPGYRAISWSLDPTHSTALVGELLALRAAATVLAVGGGGAGGLFIPLVVDGWLLGRCAEGLLSTKTSLFPVIGAAAFLGAGYRTPIAAVVFVAETTGRPGFIVPALLATAVAQLVMGSRSVTDQQLTRRLGALERRLQLPVRLVMEPVPAEPDPSRADTTRGDEALDPDMTLDDALRVMRRTSTEILPVVEPDGTTVGIVRASMMIDGEHDDER